MSLQRRQPVNITLHYFARVLHLARGSLHLRTAALHLHTEVWQLDTRVSNCLTLKAFANFSPGLLWQPWEHQSFRSFRNPEGVASNVAESQQASQPLQGCEESIRLLMMTQGFKANPGLKLANAFSVISLKLTCSQTLCL